MLLPTIQVSVSSLVNMDGLYLGQVVVIELVLKFLVEKRSRDLTPWGEFEPLWGIFEPILRKFIQT